MTHLTVFPSFAVYGAGTFAVFIISMCSLIGILIYPCHKTQSYNMLLAVMLGLAVGSLTADALLHLIPHVSIPMYLVVVSSDLVLLLEVLLVRALACMITMITITALRRDWWLSLLSGRWSASAPVHGFSTSSNWPSWLWGQWAAVRRYVMMLSVVSGQTWSPDQELGPFHKQILLAIINLFSLQFYKVGHSDK